MIGPFIDSTAVLVGCGVGIALKKHIPEKIIIHLPDIFSLITLGLAISLIIKVNNFLYVTIALLLGYITGELMRLEHMANMLTRIAKKFGGDLSKGSPCSNEEYDRLFSTLIMLLCGSITGIIGAITEGLTGQYDYLLIKSVIDFFSAITFSITLGLPMAFLALPLFVTESLLYWSAGVLSPILTPTAMQNFMACGGVILLGAGVNLTRLKHIPVLVLLPALPYIVIISYAYP